ncbi:hypothetical protein K7432_015578 [Basidiobolus ranarum]|uniref:Chitin-binding type-3 domain-containing protein n=1 Tax=Basidiobolus ranarum TaxID=34480 RepID=A0ABR2WG33_9FUNG
MRAFTFSSLAVCVSMLLGSVSCHMEIKSPAPRKSTFSKYYQSIGDIDYDMNGPLGIFPCKGYKAGPVEYTFNAGDTISVEFPQGNTHSGGHCQFALSYDNDKTFVVLKTIVRNCFLNGLKFDVPLPATAPPSERLTFAWTWINAVGNREYYMNCIDIKIKGGTPGGKVTGPKLLVANLPGYPTIPEMNLGQGDGRELLDQRPTITVGPTDNGSNPDPTTKPSTTTSATTTSAPTTTENPGTGPCNGVGEWKASTAYNGAQKVTYNGHLWQAKWWTQNEIPGKQNVWTDLGTC